MADSTAKTSVRLRPNVKPTVIGLYGIQGCGKSYLMNQFKKSHSEELYAYFDGSQVISEIVDGGLTAFKNMSNYDKEFYRKAAIRKIRGKCADSGKVGIVTGHLMFWDEGKEPETIITEADLEVYSHIIFLEVSPEVIAQRRQDDNTRNRPMASLEHLGKWQNAEKDQLRRLCRKHTILFVSVRPSVGDNSSAYSKVSTYTEYFQSHSEELNLSQAYSILDQEIDAETTETVLLFDGDKTLSDKDSGELVWEELAKTSPAWADEHGLGSLFSGKFGYSHKAFQQATLMYEELATNEEFDQLCKKVAKAMKVYPIFEKLLRSVARHKHIKVIVVTCGLQPVWTRVIQHMINPCVERDDARNHSLMPPPRL